MPLGPGKYDEICTLARQAAGSPHGCVLIVFGGNQGHGFSVQATPAVLEELPAILRDIAGQIEADTKARTG